MCALQFASQSEQKQLDISQDYDLSFNRLKNLDKKLSDLLTK
jgi:cell division protein ZapA